MVSEVSFPTFWGVFRSIKVVFVSEIGSAVSEIWRFVRLPLTFYLLTFDINVLKIAIILHNLSNSFVI